MPLYTMHSLRATLGIFKYPVPGHHRYSVFPGGVGLDVKTNSQRGQTIFFPRILYIKDCHVMPFATWTHSIRDHENEKGKCLAIIIKIVWKSSVTLRGSSPHFKTHSWVKSVRKLRTLSPTLVCNNNPISSPNCLLIYWVCLCTLLEKNDEKKFFYLWEILNIEWEKIKSNNITRLKQNIIEQCVRNKFD